MVAKVLPFRYLSSRVGNLRDGETFMQNFNTGIPSFDHRLGKAENPQEQLKILQECLRYIRRNGFDRTRIDQIQSLINSHELAPELVPVSTDVVVPAYAKSSTEPSVPTPVTVIQNRVSIQNPILRSVQCAPKQSKVQQRSASTVAQS